MLATKWKASSFWSLVRKIYPFMVIVGVVLALDIYVDINGRLKYNYDRIQYKEELVYNLRNNIDTEYNNIKSFNVDKWVHTKVTDVNVEIYKDTDYLNSIASSSQEKLSSIGKGIDTEKTVKFLVIHRPSGKFITNERAIYENKSGLVNRITENNNHMEENNVRGVYEERNGISERITENFNYIEDYIDIYSHKYKVFYTENSPAVQNFNEHLNYIKNPGDYVEIYWIPNSLEKSDPSLSDLIVYDEEAREQAIANETNQLQFVKEDFNQAVIKFIANIVWLIVILVLMFNIGVDEGKKLIRDSFLHTAALKLKELSRVLMKSILSLRDIFACRSLGFKFILFLCISVVLLINIALLFASGYVFGGVLLVVPFIYVIYVLPKLLFFIRNLSRIIAGTEKMVQGDLDYNLKEKGEKNLSILAKNINTIRNGFKVSIDDQIKNEKLKSELVANVSHDLKTPLTSIINYTDILMRDGLTEEEKEDYIKILNNKSLKLKSLIEDLFEVSKINSGKIEITKEKVDVIELINQAIGEYSASSLCSSKNLDFIFKTFKNKIELELDGKKISRVFENLITNALKYSLENTRVYVEVYEIQNGIRIGIKNISKFQLDFDEESIFERFTRGDKSRNSNVEGNGLGLAIAKSLVEAHNGKMYIELDGDLFKAFIEFYN